MYIYWYVYRGRETGNWKNGVQLEVKGGFLRFGDELENEQWDLQVEGSVY